MSRLFEVNLNKINDISLLIAGCLSLKELPDISNWNISKANDISGLFTGYSKLAKSIDISKWSLINY